MSHLHMNEPSHVIYERHGPMGRALEGEKKKQMGQHLLRAVTHFYVNMTKLIHMWHDSFICKYDLTHWCVAWLFHTHTHKHTHTDTFSFLPSLHYNSYVTCLSNVWHDSIILRLVDVWHVPIHSYVTPLNSFFPTTKKDIHVYV